MKKTKWATYKFNAGEKAARAKWRQAQDQRCRIIDGLMLVTIYNSRKQMHERLDRRLDTIEKMEAAAKELFPEVDESFTVATDTIRF